MSEDQDGISIERAIPTKEELEAIRRTDRAILESTRGGVAPFVYISISDFNLLCDFLQRDVNLFMCPETDAIIYKGTRVLWKPED